MRKWLEICLISIFSAAAVFAVCLCVIGSKPDKLSAEGITALRVQYPEVELAPLVEYVICKLDGCLELAPFVAEIEVIGALPDYEVEIEGEMHVFQQYQVKICEVFKNNDGTPLAENMLITCRESFFGDTPDLYAGLKAIAVLSAGKGPHTGTYGFGLPFFYVTEDSYVLSAYEEFYGDNYTGLAKKDFIKVITKMIK